ncbi:MAG: flagellar motor switch protein FliN [Desulfocapsa sp.]|nr:MAG: flagellar motor switch protein FliN [Desulfocapsa sp.]
MTDETVNDNARPDPEEIKELLDDEGMDTSVSSEPPSENVEESSPSPSDRGLEFLYDVPLQISVEVGRSKILLKDLLKMGEGYVIELDKLAGDPLDLYVNSRLIAKGEAVMVGEKFGIRLTDVVNASERIEQLG